MNLIITHTPLQCLIAEKIIKLHPKEKFYCICFSHTKNEKSEYYFSRVKSLCIDAKFVKLYRHIFFFVQLLFFRLFFFRKRFDTVFLASIDSLFCHTILSSIKVKSIKTFDDGSANIIKHGIFYDERYSIKETISKKILLINFNMLLIKKMTMLHFTIYKDLSNIIENTQLIQLINYKITNIPKKEKKISILLGQPLYADASKNKEIFQKIVNQGQFDFYFPHPRENYHIEHINYIKTKFIFEHFLEDLINEYQTIIIYTIFSSTILNIANLSCVKINIIFLPDFKKEIEALKNLGNFKILNKGLRKQNSF